MDKFNHGLVLLPFLFLILLGCSGLVVSPVRAAEGEALSPRGNFSGDETSYRFLQQEDKFQFFAPRYRVNKVFGEPYKLGPGDTEWERVEAGTTLPANTRLATLEGDSIVVEVPGISYIKLNKKSEVRLEELDRTSTSERSKTGILKTKSKKHMNKINLEMFNGEISQSIRSHQDQKIDYEIETPHATAGVRGTTFSCEISEDGTECAVLEGEVQFSSRGGLGLKLGPGSKTGVGRSGTEPETPTTVSDTETETLEKSLKEARKALLLEPIIFPVSAENSKFEEVDTGVFATTIDYYRPRALEISGEARAREESQEIARVQAQSGTGKIDVDGTKKWRFKISQDTLPVGKIRQLQVKMTAVDDTGTTSDTITLKINLQHPDMEGVLPPKHRPGTVALSLSKLGRQNVGSANFPYHLYRDDLRDTGRIDVVGSARSRGSVAGVAYSLNEGITWREATGTRNWKFTIPLEKTNRFHFQPRMIGWNSEKQISDARNLPAFIFHDMNYRTKITRLMNQYLESILTGQLESSSRLNSQDFKFQPSVASGAYEIDTFKEVVKEVSRTSANLDILYTDFKHRIRSGTAVTSFKLQIYGEHKPTGRQLTLFAAPIKFHWQRVTDGKFRLKSIRNFPVRLYIYNSEPIELKEKQGLSLKSFQPAQPEESIISVDRRYDSWVVQAGSKVESGGVFKLKTENVSEAFPVPEMNSSLYQSAELLEAGKLYSFFTKVADEPPQIGLLRPRKLTEESIRIEVLLYRNLLSELRNR